MREIRFWRRLGLAVLVLFAAPACGLADHLAAAQADLPALETIPLDLSGPRPTAQLSISGGPPVTAIFDTGAAATILRLDYATRSLVPNNGSANAHGPGGALIEGFQTNIAQGTLGGAHFTSALAVAINIALPLPGIDAVVSPGVFAGRLVRFDFRAGAAQVLVKTRDTLPAGPSDPYVGEDTHGQIKRTPGIRVELPGRPSFMAIADTGAMRGINLPLSMAAGLPLVAPLAPTDPVRMLGATHPAFHAQLQGVLHIGPLELQNPDIVFEQGAEGAVIGMPILRDTIIVLDPAAHRSWILPATPAPPATGAHP